MLCEINSPPLSSFENAFLVQTKKSSWQFETLARDIASSKFCFSSSIPQTNLKAGATLTAAIRRRQTVDLIVLIAIV